MSSSEAGPAHAGPAEEPPFLPSLVEALRTVLVQGQDMRTADFVKLVNCISRVFSYIGSVMSFAKTDVVAKAASLQAASEQHELLRTMVEQDERAGVATVKNSNARNLHRLAGCVKFLRLLLEKLLESRTTSMKVRALPPCTRMHACMHPTPAWQGAHPLHFLRPLSQDAASYAYKNSLSHIHPYVRRQHAPSARAGPREHG